MSNITAQTSANIFYKARCDAAKHNDSLSSREGASDQMAIDRGRLYRIESGITYPNPDEVRLMCDLYNAPELENHYCTNICPLGMGIPQAFVADLDRISLRTLSAFKKVEETKEILLDITADGTIHDYEMEGLNKVLKTLDELEQVAQSLKIWAKKNLKEEGK
ncbi:MAG: hypothetical protein LUD72_03025 [Bacteroidales bacterium]|nr:hypothetical protein [Bacteroidales bacterium]